MLLLAVSSMALQPADPADGDGNVIAWKVEPIPAAVPIGRLVPRSDRGGWRVFDSPVARFVGRLSYPIRSTAFPSPQIGIPSALSQ